MITDEMKRKMSLAAKRREQKKRDSGYKTPEDVRKKLSASMKTYRRTI